MGGVQALRAANRAGSVDHLSLATGPAIGVGTGLRQGFLTDLANPKIGMFFTSLLPQFVDPGRSILFPFLALGAVFVLMTILWLFGYCLVAARVADTLVRPRVRAALDRFTGIVLIGVGLRLAVERR
jgi:threonine/homoserine/homoserine lactone efflux protein